MKVSASAAPETGTRREGGSHFRSVFDASAIGIALVGLTGVVERCNPALARMLGLEQSAIHGRPFSALTLEEDAERDASRFEELLGGGRNELHGDARLRRADGRTLWARLAVTVVRNTEGAATGVLVMAEDITAERAVQDERDRVLFELRERVKEATALHGTSRILQEVTLPMGTMLQRIAELLPPAFQFPEITSAAITFGAHGARTAGFVDSPRRIARSFDTLDGTHGRIEVVLTADPPKGAAAFLVEEQRLVDSIAESLTVAIDHRRATQALLRSEERLQLTISAARVGLWEWDLLSGRVTWSEELERLVGLPPGGFGGTVDDYRALVHPDDLAVVQQSFRLAMEDPSREDAFETELRMGRSEGSMRWYLSRGRVLRDAAGRPVRALGLTHDISNLRDLQRQFEQSQKMEALGRLAGGIAHDFNNLLTAMQGYAEFVLNDLTSDDPHAADMREIVAATDRAAALTRQLLAFSRTQALDRRVVEVNEVVTGMEKLLRRLIGQHITFAVDLDPDVGSVRIDVGQLEQVLLNLAVNARDAMPDGGQLTIQTRPAHFDERVELEGFDVRAGRYVQLQVSDTGTGMTPEVRARIFEAFFTTKEVGRGTGLGLATVHGIVGQAGGAIFVYSEPGRGSAFKIYLPWEGDAGEARTGVSLTAEGLRGTESILLVDDDDSVRTLSERALRNAGYTVHAFGNPLEALSFITQRKAAVDLLVTDVVMPRLQGPELAAQLRRRNGATRVLYITGFSDRPIEPESQPHLLQKPFAPSGLLRAVRELLDGAP